MALYVTRNFFCEFFFSLTVDALPGYYVIFTLILVITALVSIYHTQIVNDLTPVTRFLKRWVHRHPDIVFWLALFYSTECSQRGETCQPCCHHVSNIRFMTLLWPIDILFDPPLFNGTPWPFEYQLIGVAPRSYSFGWLVPVAILFIISFPPVSFLAAHGGLIPDFHRSAIWTRNCRHPVRPSLGSLDRFRYCVCWIILGRSRQLLVCCTILNPPHTCLMSVAAPSNIAVVHAARNWKRQK